MVQCLGGFKSKPHYRGILLVLLFEIVDELFSIFDVVAEVA